MIKTVRTDSENNDFIELVRQLDAFLTIRDGDDHTFYDQYNKLDKIKHVVIAYENELPIGCAAIKKFDQKSMEIKRMYTAPQSRGKGIATLMLTELEKWAAELGFEKCILETGKALPEAIKCYQKNNYKTIPNFGPYKDVESSICLEKYLATK